MKRYLWLLPVLTAAAMLSPMSSLLAATGHEQATAGHDLGSLLPLWSVIPFAGILLSIAIFPLVAPHFWHRHFPKVSAFWALVFAVPFLFAFGVDAWHEILHIYLIDYIINAALAFDRSPSVLYLLPPPFPLTT